ncbi:hypothetical protein XENOCAPTIV_028008, partial [Xenoophorus captivus]
ILDSMLLLNKHICLTHEVLCTLMAENTPQSSARRHCVAEAKSSTQKWTMAIITTTFPSTDGKVRKVEVRTSSQGISKTYLRPISDVVMLLENEVADNRLWH